MSLGAIRTRKRDRCLDRRPDEENLAGMLRTGNPIYIVKEHMDGSLEAIYHVNMVHLLDRVFTRDSLKYLSIDQERYLNKFFQEAGVVDTRINESIANPEDNIDPYAYMDDVMRQLDNFLGSYFGVDYGRFAR